MVLGVDGAVEERERRRVRGAGRDLALWLLAGGLTSCGPWSPRADVPLTLERFSQAGVREVYLNEVLTFRFSAPVDRISVHRRSLRILDSSGGPVAGDLEVEAATVRFVPRLASTADLMDGGFLPGRDYVVELPGFPEHNTIVARDGRPLAYGYRFPFHTVPLETGHSPYLDGSPSGGPRILSLEPRYGRLGSQDAIRLDLSEPVLPWSVGPDTVKLWGARPHEDGLDPIEARVALAQREDEAQITVRPRRGGFRPGWTYVLDVSPGLVDFSGFPLTPPLPAPLLFHGAEPLERGEVRFTFEASSWRDETEDEDRGLLQPGPEGELRMRILQESGTGAAGTLRVGGGIHRDVAAAAPGLSSLRRLVIERGATLRVEGGASATIAAAEDLWIEGSLIRRIERVLEEGVALRLFANGDLHLEGELVVQGPDAIPEGAEPPTVWVRVGGRIRFGPQASLRFEGAPGRLRLEDADGVVEGWTEAVSGTVEEPEIRKTDPTPPLRLLLASPLRAVVRTRFRRAEEDHPDWERLQWAGERGEAEVEILVSGAPAIPGDDARPDREHATPFTGEIRELRGLPFLRLRITVTLPPGRDLTPTATQLAVRDVRALYRR